MACAEEAIALLAAQAGEPIDLLAAMQNLALEIAGRSMFSLETRQYGAAMRRMLTEFGMRHARLHLLDMVLPPSIPTPRDLGRRRFQRRWMALIETIVRERLRRRRAMRRAICSICCWPRAIRRPGEGSRASNCAIRPRR